MHVVVGSVLVSNERRNREVKNLSKYTLSHPSDSSGSGAVFPLEREGAVVNIPGSALVSWGCGASLASQIWLLPSAYLRIVPWFKAWLYYFSLVLYLEGGKATSRRVMRCLRNDLFFAMDTLRVYTQHFRVLLKPCWPHFL